jgi:hypothetical protein
MGDHLSMTIGPTWFVDVTRPVPNIGPAGLNGRGGLYKSAHADCPTLKTRPFLA